VNIGPVPVFLGFDVGWPPCGLARPDIILSGGLDLTTPTNSGPLTGR
jgi:hypothetical protein